MNVRLVLETVLIASVKRYSFMYICLFLLVKISDVVTQFYGIILSVKLH